MDQFSMSFASHEWSLRVDVALHIFHRWGFPQLDLFETHQNRKESLGLLLHGALWNAVPVLYILPPFPLVHKVILRV